MVAKQESEYDSLWDGVCAYCCAQAAPGADLCLDCQADLMEEWSEPQVTDILEAWTCADHGGD